MIYDCLIIGGGPAGLAVALNLARLLHTAAVFDSQVYRNDGAALIHNVLGFDHLDARAFRSKAKSDIAKYNTIDFKDVCITTARKLKSGLFEVKDDRGQVYTGRKLVLCIGVRDVMFDIPGFDECWAKGIYNCLFCHAFESRGAASVGVIAMGPCTDPAMALHVGRMALQFGKKLTLYTNGRDDIAQDILAQVASDKDIEVDLRQISQLRMASTDKSAVTVTFSDDTERTEGFFVSSNTVEINGCFVQQLGLELCPSGEIRTRPPLLETNVPGVFAAGDCATTLRAIPQAAAHGALVAVAIAHQLQAEKRARGNGEEI